jgi:predicted Holliday junction resolvase-like endonuclease
MIQRRRELTKKLDENTITLEEAMELKEILEEELEESRESKTKLKGR